MLTVRYGVIGIGGIGALHCRFAREHPKAELTAVADVDPALVSATAEKFGVRGFADHRDLLAAGVVDAVSIATPHHLHAPMALDCLRAGVHVFVEKPIAVRVSEADAMVATAAARRLKLCVGHQYRTFRASQVMKHVIDTGLIGTVMRVLWSWVRFRPAVFFRGRPWLSEWHSAGGGVGASQLSHDLDTLCWLVGKPVRVTALMANQLHEAAFEDVLCASILFENGAHASVQASFNESSGYCVRQIAGDRGVIVVQDAQSLSYDHGEEIRIGTYDTPLAIGYATLTEPTGAPKTSWHTISLPRGVSRRVGLRERLMRRARGVPREEGPPLPAGLAGLLERFRAVAEPRPHGLAVLMDSFVDSILGGGEPLVGGESATLTLELVNAITLSAMRRRAVDLPLDRAEYDALFEELGSGKVRVPRFRAGRPA